MFICLCESKNVAEMEEVEALSPLALIVNPSLE